MTVCLAPRAALEPLALALLAQQYGHVTPKMRGNAAAQFGSLMSRARLAPVATAAGDQL